MSVVYDVGYGDNKSAQWVKLAMFGQRAEKLVSHFTKGKQIVATMDDVKTRAYTDKNSGEARASMEAKLVEFDFAGGDSSQQQAPQQQHQQPAPQQPMQQPQMAQQAPVSYGTAPANHQPAQQAPQQPQYAQAPQIDNSEIPF